MANHKSAKKRIRQNVKRRARNRLLKASCRTAIKKTRAAVEAGNAEEAQELYKQAQSIIASAATKGMYHPNNASRKIARLAALVNKAQA